MPYIYEKDDVLEGVPLKMFGLAPWAYQNSSTYADNKGFEVNDQDSVPTGLMRVDPCRFGTINNSFLADFLFLFIPTRSEKINYRYFEEKCQCFISLSALYSFI